VSALVPGLANPAEAIGELGKCTGRGK